LRRFANGQLGIGEMRKHMESTTTITKNEKIAATIWVIKSGTVKKPLTMAVITAAGKARLISGFINAQNRLTLKIRAAADLRDSLSSDYKGGTSILGS
jgi:hypothetical protein